MWASVIKLDGAALLVEHFTEEANRQVPLLCVADEGETGPQTNDRFMDLCLRWRI